jgi:tetratricopeptide (TPR) repeat protein
MNKQSLVFAISGTMFGLMVGWIIGSQQASPGAGSLPVQASQSTASTEGGQAPPALDEVRVKALTNTAAEQPKDSAVRVELGNLYFDAERFADAITWYEEALKIDDRNVNASTDLGVSYYYSNQPDKALAQFAHSLSIDPKHPKTLLNVGIVRAFGKQDLEGAAQAWQEVIAVAPDTTEARAAKQALDGMRAAHPETGTGQAPKGGN